MSFENLTRHSPELDIVSQAVGSRRAEGSVGYGLPCVGKADIFDRPMKGS